MITPTQTTCWLDTNDLIVRVSPEWDVFALANDGEQAVGAKVCGRRLLDFVAGDITRIWVHNLLCKARMGRRIERDYRCDSPTMKRYMQLAIELDAERTVRMRHTLLREEPMQHPVEFALGSSSAPYRERCSICNRIQIADQWHEADAVNAGQNPVAVLYTICPDCSYMLSDFQM